MIDSIKKKLEFFLNSIGKQKIDILFKNEKQVNGPLTMLDNTGNFSVSLDKKGEKFSSSNYGIVTAIGLETVCFRDSKNKNKKDLLLILFNLLCVCFFFSFFLFFFLVSFVFYFYHDFDFISFSFIELLVNTENISEKDYLLTPTSSTSLFIPTVDESGQKEKARTHYGNVGGPIIRIRSEDNTNNNNEGVTKSILKKFGLSDVDTDKLIVYLASTFTTMVFCFVLDKAVESFYTRFFGFGKEGTENDENDKKDSDIESNSDRSRYSFRSVCSESNNDDDSFL